ncbi:hypothetical protein Pla110_31300 [Polystyrenella longa]|uniref:Uncharacterized protein n=1 Tax=Polystyrenella longa TaxID=2528007 RepID=A0A518CQ89_9PLAN|nr:hypothetical protein Pla110_31300 [Polystyrenella longa]
MRFFDDLNRFYKHACEELFRDPLGSETDLHTINWAAHITSLVPFDFMILTGERTHSIHV